MQKNFTSRSLLALGAIGLALLPLSGAVNAGPKNKNRGKKGPPVFAPAYGRRDRDRDGNEDYSDDSGDYSNDGSGQYGGRDRNGGYSRNGGYGRNTGDGVRYGNYGRIVTLEGVVTSADGNGDFRVQAGGRSFDVTNTARVRVRQGQRVVLRGSFDQNNDFDARNVSVAGRAGDIGSDNDPYGNDYRPGQDQRVNFPGVVTRVYNSGELEVRADNGRTYRVQPRNDSNEYQVGNRIRVTGTASGNRIDSARITFQNGGVAGGIFGSGGNNNGNYGGSYGNGGLQEGKKVDFSGRIVRINSEARTTTAVVRGDNGREYLIRTKDLKNFSTGERVRVRGTVKNGVVEVKDID